jgi:hypothetical protein
MRATQAFEAVRMARNSVSSLTEKAAADRAAEISTSSASGHFSLKTFFHSSTKGPFDVSFVSTPTFFYEIVSEYNDDRKSNKLVEMDYLRRPI